MTKEEAIKHFKEQLDIFGGEHAEAIKVAIEALKNKSRPFGDCSKCIHTYGTLGCCTTVSNEWVYDCEHGMEQYKSTKAEPNDDGTLEVKVEDATKVGRVLISDDKHRGGLYYPDEDEPKGDDLISRAEAIEHFMRLSEDESLSPITQTLIVGVSNEIKKLPSADRPRGEWATDEVAELLANIFGDECACNWNGNDEWLPEVCKYAETTCPSPKEANGCWKQFLIQGGAKRR